MPQGPPRKSTSAASASKWHAVSVQAGEPPCDAVLRMRNVRFLAAEAPRIPVPYCAWPARCQCVYRHHADRRVGLRRIADRGMYARPAPVERRKQQDRRRAED